MKNILRKAAGLLAFMMLAAACAAAASDEPTLKVTYIRPPFNVPSMVERHFGLFEQYCGMPVEYVTLANGPEQVHALAAGDVQFLPAAGSTSVFLAASNGADFRILSVFARAPKSFKILAAANSPMSRPSDLKGKTVAGPRGTILNELLALWLAQDGLSEKDVTFVNMNIAAAAAALAAGKVDAALLTGVPAWKMAQKGFKVLRDGENLVGGEVLTVTTQKMLRHYPELVRHFMQARRQSVKWMNEHPAEALKIAAEELGLTPEEAEAQFPLYDFSPDITEKDAEALQRTVDFMVSKRMMKPLDVKKLFAVPVK
ncbi:MAG: ABC transporter substrate-binding protein [Pyramidobacter sp.]|jgi:sulfonate transport system substrate-binding protein